VSSTTGRLSSKCQEPQDFGLTQPFLPLAYEQRVSDLETPHRRYEHRLAFEGEEHGVSAITRFVWETPGECG
jgi:hypothetical protein